MLKQKTEREMMEGWQPQRKIQNGGSSIDIRIQGYRRRMTQHAFIRNFLFRRETASVKVDHY